MAVGWSTQAKNDAVNAVGSKSTAVWIGVFAGDPTAGGAEVNGGAYSRKQASWPDAANGTTTTPVVTIDMPANSDAKYVARFTTASGGTPYDVRALPNNGEHYGSAGKLDLTNNIYVV